MNEMKLEFGSYPMLRTANNTFHCRMFLDASISTTKTIETDTCTHTYIQDKLICTWHDVIAISEVRKHNEPNGDDMVDSIKHFSS